VSERTDRGQPSRPNMPVHFKPLDVVASTLSVDLWDK
jgi:hypothetical protein